MKRESGQLLKYTSQIERGDRYFACDLVERHLFREPTRQKCLCGFSFFRVIDCCACSLEFFRSLLIFESGFQNIGNQINNRHVSPKMLQWLFLDTLQAPDNFKMIPEKLCAAGSGDESKWLIRMFINCWIEFPDDIIQYLRC